jgi:hypothetical protein
LRENKGIPSEVESCKQMETTQDREERSNTDGIYNKREELEHKLPMLEKNRRFNIEENASKRKDNIEVDEEMQRDKLISKDILEKNERPEMGEKEIRRIEIRQEESLYKERLLEQGARSSNEDKRRDMDEEIKSLKGKDNQLAAKDNNLKKHRQI